MAESALGLCKVCIGYCTLNMAMKKMMLSVSDDMLKALEAERKARKLETVPEAVRAVLGEYFKNKDKS